MEELSQETDNTEKKIRQVAKRIFTERGYSGTKIRDVAEEAGVNIALLNYYFRSKERLYQSILNENFEEYACAISESLNAKDLPLETRIRRYVSQLIDQLKENPDLPFFIMSECRNNSQFCKDILTKKWKRFEESELARQLKEEAQKGNIHPIDPIMFEHIMNSQIVMPFLGMPFLQHIHGFQSDDFTQFMEKQKEIIPDLVMAYLKRS
jgi:AcrR family transcriptional regulator